ncbi:multidrug effflux MFS transporter [Streptococcus sp. DD13]|uniref:multidrug effflux MFS transporter n=1 Tax=Streptococcus sp. DD13 TaxID=1777881 RepID=UPI00079149DF|nr:multidrug effflux MFS transporter [Streptococcus sp. DD13]KXT77929.1 putative transport transmembrane protein [Streptococcus sp. DD13]
MKNKSFLIISGLLMAFTSLSTDVYLPAMPTMEKELGGQVELTVTGFLVGFALAQLVWGPISDRIGRKIPLYLGLVIFILGSLGCALSTDMTQVIIWRVFQAFGACVGPMLSRAMSRDLFDSREAAQVLSTLMIIAAVAPILGPFIGGFIVSFTSWHVIFYFMALAGTLMLYGVYRLPETLPKEKRGHMSLLRSFSNYGQLLTNRSFMLYTLCVTFYYVGAYAFITGSSTVYITYFHVPEQDYGFLFGVNVLGIVGLNLFNRRLVERFSLRFLLRCASVIALLASLALWGLNLGNGSSIWTLAIPVFFVFSMNGIIAACSNAAALAFVSDEMTGSASALLGSLQYGSGILSSALLASFAATNGHPGAMVTIILVSVALAFLTTLLAKNVPQIKKSV